MQLLDRQETLDESRGVLRRMLSETVAEAGELEALRSALRECRQRLHRGALESTRRIVALNSSVASLETLTQSQQSQIRTLEADLSLLGEQRRQLLCRKDAGEQYSEAAHQQAQRDAHCVWTLKKNLADAHAEYGKLAEERDRLALQCSELGAPSGDPLRALSCSCPHPQTTDQ
jgi:chromosome segregation ATPase